MTYKEDTYWSTQRGLDLQPCVDADDYLHLDLCLAKPHPKVCETQFFGFSVPEAGIHATNYICHHVHQKHIMGGACVFEGVRHHSLSAQLCDLRLYMTDEPLKNDMHSVTLENGYHTEVIEPMKRHRISYDDPSRGNSFDIEYTALAPAVGMVKTGHFEQLMKTKGHVSLRGKRHAVDGYTIRNRTWAEVRDEAHVVVPPVGWTACVVDENFAFCCTAHDDPELDPVWKGHFDIAPEKQLLGGWLWRDNEILGLKSISKITRYSGDTLVPESLHFILTDEKDREYEVKGTVKSACPFDIYVSHRTWLCLADVTVNGVQAAQCDFQDMHWHDFLNIMAEKA